MPDGKLRPNGYEVWKGGRVDVLNSLATKTTGINDTDRARMTDVEAGVSQMMTCLREGLDSSLNVSNTISDLQSEILRVSTSLSKQEKAIDIAKERLQYVKDEQKDVSYYQGWFPIQRPLKQTTVPVLVFLTILFLMFSCGLLLKMGGMQVQVGMPWIVALLVAPGTTQFTPAFWLTFGLLFVSIALAVYAFRRK
jgi:hypothetical protein